MGRKKPNYMAVNVDEVIDDLQMGVLDILFEKVDGTTRLLKCTLQPYYFKKAFLDENEKQARANSISKEGETNVPVLHVWDVQEHDWRSFRLDRVLSIQLTNG